MGVEKYKRPISTPGLLMASGEVLRYAEVVITSAEVKALRATPKVLVPAPGPGKVLEFVSGAMFLDAGTNVFTETADNLSVRYHDGTGALTSGSIETTGFIDQAADMMTVALPTMTQVAKAASENKALVLHNTGDGEIGGNAAGDGKLVFRMIYRVHRTV